MKTFLASLLWFAIIIVGPSSSLEAQLHKLPIPISELQQPDNHLVAFRGDLYTKTFDSHILRLENGQLHRVDPTGGSPDGPVARFLEVVGDHLYYAGTNEIWRTDGETVERVLQLPEFAYLTDGTGPSTRLYQEVDRIGDVIYLPLEYSLGRETGYVRISATETSLLPTPFSFPTASKRTFVVGDRILVRTGFRHDRLNAPYHVLEGDSVRVLSGSELGIGKFELAGFSPNHLYLLSDDTSGVPTIYRTDFETTESLFAAPDFIDKQSEIYEKGSNVYVISSDRVSVWTDDEEIREIPNPLSEADSFSIYREDRQSWAGETDGFLVVTSATEKVVMRFGDEGLERSADHDMLQQLYPSKIGSFNDSLGWCGWSDDDNAGSCVKDGYVVSTDFPVGARTTEFDGRLFWTDRDGFQSMTVTANSARYRAISPIISSTTRFLGNHDDLGLISAGHPGGPDKHVLWTTDGQSARVVGPRDQHVRFQLSDGKTSVFRSGTTFWTLTGESVGTGADYFGEEIAFSNIESYAVRGDEVFFDVTQPAELAGLWRRRPDGTERITEFEGNTMVLDSTVYILELGDRSLHRYDGNTVAPLDGGVAPYRSMWDLRGKVLALGQGGMLIIQDGRQEWVETDFNMMGRVSHNGFLYFHADGFLWKTDGDTFEKVIESNPLVLSIASHEGSLYMADAFTKKLWVENPDGTLNDMEAPQTVADSETGFRWLQSPQNGLFLFHEYQIHRVSGGTIALASDEKVLPKGWVGDNLIVEHLDRRGLFSLNLSGSAVSNDQEALQPLWGQSISIDAYPNPIIAAGTVRVQSEQAHDIEIEVRDALGRLIKTLHRGSLSKGEHTLTFDAGNLAAGAYFIRALTPDEAITKPVIVAR